MMLYIGIVTHEICWVMYKTVFVVFFHSTCACQLCHIRHRVHYCITKITSWDIGEQRALSLETWPISNIGSDIGYSCVWTRVVSCEYSVLSTGVNTFTPHFKTESKFTCVFAAQCSILPIPANNALFYLYQLTTIKYLMEWAYISLLVGFLEFCLTVVNTEAHTS